MVKEALEALRQLRARDLRVLHAVERGMARFQYVPVDEISRFTGLNLDEVLLITRKLNALGLLRRWVGSYVGYVLTVRGYDCLALNALAKRGTLKSIAASPIGRGKEADVYQGVTPAGRTVAVKFHRVGRTSFRQTRRYRTYVGDRYHISWLYQSRIAAKSEYEALRALFSVGVSVPEPIDWNRNVVVCEYVEGVELSEAPPLPDPSKFLETLLDEVKKAYQAGIIHADLSEYNILASPKGPVIFDWPQWISRNHPSAIHYLRRDLENVLKFFKRKYNISYNLDECIRRILDQC